MKFASRWSAPGAIEIKDLTVNISVAWLIVVGFVGCVGSGVLGAGRWVFLSFGWRLGVEVGNFSVGPVKLVDVRLNGSHFHDITSWRGQKVEGREVIYFWEWESSDDVWFCWFSDGPEMTHRMDQELFGFAMFCWP